jgi:hypothetical protein
MKRTLAGVALAAALAVPANAAEEEVRVPSLSAPFGAGVTEQVVIFERLIAKRHPWVRLVAQESPGFVYNIKEMASNKKRYKTTTDHHVLVEHGRAVGGKNRAEGFLRQAHRHQRVPLDGDALKQLHLVRDAGSEDQIHQGFLGPENRPRPAFADALGAVYRQVH